MSHRVSVTAAAAPTSPTSTPTHPAEINAKKEADEFGATPPTKKRKIGETGK